MDMSLYMVKSAQLIGVRNNDSVTLSLAYLHVLNQMFLFLEEMSASDR